MSNADYTTLDLKGLSFNRPHANIDKAWGPYQSLSAALDTNTGIDAELRVKGFKFGVEDSENNSIKEYIFTDNLGTYKEVALVKDDLNISSNADDISYTRSGDSSISSVQDALDADKEELNNLEREVVKVDPDVEGNNTQFLRCGGVNDPEWDNITGDDVSLNVTNLDSFNEEHNSESLQNIVEKTYELLKNSVNVNVNSSTKTFAIKTSNNTTVGTIVVGEGAGGSATLTLNSNENNVQPLVVTLPNLKYDSSRQVLQYVNALGQSVDTVRLSNLQIKKVLASAPLVDQEPPATADFTLGDLILVGPDANDNNSYELNVCTKADSDGQTGTEYLWDPLGKINDVSLVAEAISYSGIVTGSTVKAAIDGLGGRMTSVENSVPNMADVYENGLFIVDGNGNIGVKINESGLDAVVSPNLQNTIKGFVGGGDGQGSGDGTIIHITPETKGWGINILIIGNSFSSDAAAYLPKLLEQSNVVEFNVGILYAANKNLFHHRNNLSGSSNDDYTYWEYSSDITNGGHWTQETSVKIWDGIGKRQWDIILTHELSNDSGDITHITNSLPQIVSYISNRIDYESKYGYILTPAWGHNVSANSDTMWANINSVGKYIAQNYPQVSLIVPIHTAMQNARTNNTLASYGADLNQGSSDKHSESGVGRFIQSYTLLLSLNELFKTEFPLVNTTWIPAYGTTVKGDGSGDINIGTDGWFPRTNQFNSIETGVIELIEKAVKAARDNMWRISTIS